MADISVMDMEAVPETQGGSTQQIAALVGLDWADQEHVISLTEAGSQKVERMRIRQTPEALSEWVRAMHERFHGGSIAIALEQSRGAVIHHLSGYEYLALYPVNPKSLARYREAFSSSGAKSDPADADLLLEMVSTHRERLRQWLPNNVQTRALSLLAEHRRKLVDDRTAVGNRITSLLKDYYPQALGWAGELDTLMACDFLLRWPTLEALRRARAESLRKFYRVHGSRSRERIEQRIVEIREAVELTTDAALMRVCPVVLRSLVREMRCLTESIKEIEKEIAELYESHPDHDLFMSFPGAGAALGPRLIAAMGSERERFESAVEVQQFSGIAPVTKQSGKSKVVHRRQACPKFVRQTFHEMAGQSIRLSEWAGAYYAQQRARGKKHHAAVRALAYKWIRIIYRCWKERTQYSEERYQRELARRASPLARLLGRDLLVASAA